MEEKSKIKKYSIAKYTSKKLITIKTNAKFKNIVKLMVANNVSCLIVLDKNIPAGIITERDILQAISSGKKSNKIYAYQIMSSPVLSVKKEFDLANVIEFMKNNAIRRSLVVDQKNTLRRTDICCRWGGEEFIILLPCTEQKGAIIVAERLRKKIYINAFKYGKNNITITASFGVVCYKKEIKNERELLNKVDNALYQAKINGRNRVEFNV
ncbi:GGDEF domain-containing protein [Candidatus Desantisbacteria bacterium]|nr:GGDEF domain-containing protein [Candidatus Desantisbacteria bacterium]